MGQGRYRIELLQGVDLENGLSDLGDLISVRRTVNVATEARDTGSTVNRTLGCFLFPVLVDCLTESLRAGPEA